MAGIRLNLTSALITTVCLAGLFNVGEGVITPVLYGGGAACQGNVLATWLPGSPYAGNVCDDGWSSIDARVVCDQIGAGTVAASTTRSQFGENDIAAGMNDLQCTASDETLSTCTYNSDTCDGEDIAGVVCSDCLLGSQGDVRLVGGTSGCEGHVMIYNDGEWAHLLGQYFSASLAEKVCQSAGFSSAAHYSQTSNRYFGHAPLAVYPKGIHTLSCVGSATPTSGGCTYTSTSSVDVSQLAVVACTGGVECTYNSYPNSPGSIYVGGNLYTPVYRYTPGWYVWGIPSMAVAFIASGISHYIRRKRRLAFVAAANQRAGVQGGFTVSTQHATGVQMTGMGQQQQFQQQYQQQPVVYAQPMAVAMPAGAGAVSPAQPPTVSAQPVNLDPEKPSGTGEQGHTAPLPANTGQHQYGNVSM